jgi:hypothetical protein
MGMIQSTDHWLLVIAVKSVQEGTCFSFGNLLPELQRHCLRRSAIHLHDVARAAVTCKHLQDLYHKRCAADEQWLESEAIAVFGKEFVELVLSWLVSPEDEVPEDFLLSLCGEVIDRTRENTLPCCDDLRGKGRVTFMIWTRGLLETPQPDPAFQVHLMRMPCYRVVWLKPCGVRAGRPMVDFSFVDRPEKRELVLAFCDFPAPAVPLLGLGLMACKRIAARLATMSDSPYQPAQFERNFWVNGELEDEVEKGLQTVWMVGWRSRSQLPNLELSWCETRGSFCDYEGWKKCMDA